MQRILPDTPHPLHDIAATRRAEAILHARLPPHTLMERAGEAAARLARALAPYAETIWIACGRGNNGGDGLEAAFHLAQAGMRPVVTWIGEENRASEDMRCSLARAREAGVAFAAARPSAMTSRDLCLDALLGIGLSEAERRTPGGIAPLIAQLRSSPAPRLAVDLPSGLNADNGNFAINLTARDPYSERAKTDFHAEFTLSLLTLKPGLFTASGRDACGQVWFDDLGCADHGEPPTAWLTGSQATQPRPHASHKGDYGDVAVVGGEGLGLHGRSMAGASLLAATAALYAGAGRVFVSLLGGSADPALFGAHQPELMFRRFDTLELDKLTVVCGCGGGEAVSYVLDPVIAGAHALVLDADALNAIAKDDGLRRLVTARDDTGRATVLTPHPLEAARLLGVTAEQVQADRLAAAQRLAEAFQCEVVLKGSGTVIASPGRLPAVNPTGNARLATGGTGDVLAGLVGARLARGDGAFKAASEAVYAHGQAADRWLHSALVASELARSL
jgi:ADP-dependent NAD(P)H-hydrate dehydratase / NAD(P)H-hydrate epimerase